MKRLAEIRADLTTFRQYMWPVRSAPPAPAPVVSTPLGFDIPTDDEVLAFLDKCYEDIHPANEWAQQEIDHHRAALIAFLRYREGTTQ